MKISKITILASMLTVNLVAAQEYYTCVPKKDWWANIVKQNVPNASDIRQIVKEEVIKNLNWRPINLTPNSEVIEFQQKLQPGKYKVIAAGAGGEEEERIFILYTATKFKACVGGKSENGTDGGYYYAGGFSGKGGDGKGYKGEYKGGKGCYDDGVNWICRDGSGYGEGVAGKAGKYLKSAGSTGGIGGKGCYGGGAGGTGYGGSGGGGGGSYFEIGNLKLILKGGDGKNGSEGKGAEGILTDGYIKIEKLE